jgi:HK97 family phage prohead protease
MDIIIRSDSVEISGYVNAVERDSKTLRDRFGQFIERIRKGAFKRAIQNNSDIHVLLNHDWSRDLGSTTRGNLELTEDSIGLKARVVTDDPEVVDDARNGRLVGWSFGFLDEDVTEGSFNGLRQRIVNALDLREVSILNNKMRPAYEGTLINARSEEEQPINLAEDFITDVNVRTEDPEPQPEPQPDPEPAFDNSKYKQMIAEMKA